MLRNHGLITVADNIPDCFVRMYLFETACTVQVRAQAGGELIRIGDAIVAGGPEQMTQGTRGGPGALAWPGLLKRLDAIDPSYRE